MKQTFFQSYAARFFGLSFFILSLLMMHTFSPATASHDPASPNAKIQYSQVQNDSDIALRMELRSLLKEHTALAHVLTVNNYDEATDYNASLQAMNTNTRLLSEEMEKQFGEDAQNTFSQMWRTHINLYLEYTDALKANDADRQQQIARELDEWTVTMSEFLTRGQNADIQRSLTEHLKTHGQLTLSVITEHHRGNHTREYEIAHEGFVHAGEMADMLTHIVRD